MRWLVTGATGMLGTDLVTLLRDRGHEVTSATRSIVDLTDSVSVLELVREHDVVVNCAAWTAVDDAEQHEAEALVANAEIPGVLAGAVAQTGAWLVQLSTDYVFDGSARTPYPEDTPPCPTSAYGRTKAAGEEAVRAMLPDRSLVVRTAWLYGAHGSCFPKTIARLVRERGSVAVVTDQVGQPTWTMDVADLVVQLVKAEAPAGIYHATSAGQCSWWEFARAVIVSAGLDPDLATPTASAAFPRPAPRPTYCVLGHEAFVQAGVDPIGPWRERWDTAAPEVIGTPGPGSAEV